MRTLTILTFFLLGLGAFSVFFDWNVQAQQGGAAYEQPVPQPPTPGQVQYQPNDVEQPMAPPDQQQPSPDDRQPPWMQQQNVPTGRQRGDGREGNGRGDSRGGMRRDRSAQPRQPGIGRMNTNVVTQVMARLRALDANGNGVLESNEIPASQMARMAPMAQRLGVNLNGPVNLADLERRAMRDVSNNTPQPDPATRRQQARQLERQQRPPQTIEPLVKPFGETRPAEMPALGFGQRAPAPQAALTAGGGERPRNAVAATQVSQQQAAQAARLANMVKNSVPYDHVPQAVRDNRNFSWFFSYDTDQDTQLTMPEYINGLGGNWTVALAQEFRFLDRNDDGFATVDEALASIREKDAEMAQQQMKEQQAASPLEAKQPTTWQRTSSNAKTPGNSQNTSRRSRESSSP